MAQRSILQRHSESASKREAGRGLFGQLQVELAYQQPVVGRRLRVARQHEVAVVGGGQMDIHHLQGGELIQHGARRQAGTHPYARFFNVTCRQ